MQELEDTLNTPDGTGDEVADTQVTEPETDTANTPEGTEVAEGEATTETSEAGQDSDFLSPETRKSMDEQLAENPDLKPNFDSLKKQLQGDYTRKRQQESQKVKELEAKAQLAQQIEGDPKLVNLIQQYRKGTLNLTPPEKKEAVGDILEEATKDFSPEEKMLLGRFQPAFEKMIERAISPLKSVTETTVEKTAKTELASNPVFADVEIEDYWGDVSEIKKKYPAMSYQDALEFALGKDFKNVADTLKKFGKEDALKTTSKTEPAKKKAGFVAGGSGLGADKTHSDDTNDEDLSPEDYRKKYGIKEIG